MTSSGASAHAQFIASPNYPDRYFRNAQCRWRLRSQRTQTIRLTLVDFELESTQWSVDMSRLRSDVRWRSSDLVEMETR